MAFTPGLNILRFIGEFFVASEMSPYCLAMGLNNSKRCHKEALIFWDCACICFLNLLVCFIFDLKVSPTTVHHTFTC